MCVFALHRLVRGSSVPLRGRTPSEHAKARKIWKKNSSETCPAAACPDERRDEGTTSEAIGAIAPNPQAEGTRPVRTFLGYLSPR